MWGLARKAHNVETGGIVADGDGIAVARVRQRAGSMPLLQSCAYQAAAGDELRPAMLQQSIAAGGLVRSHCNAVLPLGEYQLLLTEAPDVPPAELRAAMRWRIRELIDFHVDDAVIDVFDAPAGGAGSAQRQMYVVVARSALIERQVTQLQNAKLDLQAIDIPELALRNIAARLAEDDHGLAMLYFGRDRGLIILTRRSELYLARTLDTGYRDLANAGPEERERLAQSLALEVQRSVDYYDRHFMQAPVSTVVLAPLPEPMPGLVDELHRDLGMQVRELALEEIVEPAASVDTSLAGSCLLAVGAALREEERRL